MRGAANHHSRGADRSNRQRSGNMADPKPDKIWSDAVRRAVMRRIENEEGKPQKIERLADKLVEFAMDGQGWAMQEIGNRLDGKPAQAVNVSGDGDNPLSVVTQIVLVDGES